MATLERVEPGFLDYVEILDRRRAVAALVASAVFAVFLGYAFLSRPVYRASTLLYLEKPVDPAGGGYQPPEEDYLPTQAKLISSDGTLRRVYARLNLASAGEFAAGLRPFRKAVSVLPVPRTRLCAISVESWDPRRAAMISNALADDFVRQNDEEQLFMSKRVLARLDARARDGNSRAVYEALPAVAGDPVVQDVRRQLAAAEGELAKLRASFKEGHPAVAAAKWQAAGLRVARDREIDRAVLAYRNTLAGAFHPNNARVADAAEPPERPVRPQKELALLLGLLGGLAAGFLAALGVDTLDQTIRTRADVERRLGLPVLGHIPFSRARAGREPGSSLATLEAPRLSEAFRELGAVVIFTKAMEAEPFLLVTSAMQHEGKSFVSTNLAASIARLGRRVLLIDADLESPCQHRLLPSPAAEGLVDVLSGAVKDPALVIRQALPQLDVLAGGLSPPGSRVLFDEERLAALVAWARERYDRVIVDCPPVLAASDLYAWGRHVRSSIVVSRPGRARVAEVRRACERLRAAGIDVLGGVINGARRLDARA